MVYSWCLLAVHLVLLWGLTPIAVLAMPPPPPIRCNDSGCTLYNSYGAWNDRKACNVPNVSYPSSEEELRLAVAYANRNKLKVKVVSGFSHTIPKLACPGSQYENSMLISTLNDNSVIEIDVANLAVTADAGVGLRELIDRVEEAGLSLVAAPYWEGVSVGGLISTGAHGSSWWGKGGAVHDHVIGLSLVVPAKESEGYAKIIRIEAQDPLLKAAKVSIGLLGVISKKYEFGDITWYPSRKTAVYRYDFRVPLTASGNGEFDFLGFQSNSIVVSQSTRAAEKSLEKANNVNGKCLLAISFVRFKKLVANGLKNGLIFTGYPVVGHQRKMQTSENFCGVDIYNGFLIRFIKASQAYLGQSEDSVVLDFNYYRADDPSTPRLNQDIWEEVEQMAFFKYGAKPHWAKNRNLAFLDVQSKYPNFSKFLAAKKILDPQNMFSSELSDEILILRKEAVKGDGCALEGQCICSEDKHCSPKHGYFCRPGLVYKEARVCRYSSSSRTSTTLNILKRVIN
ncbi:hypothetical protein GH714_036363 [Hevea brasiliensis]|uniref:FAD-binding PCMH-type domain-containing protein n=1 Tax=Hevea brasiliensis TaxID=3981 RepID=A0A6A6KF89_HEVBR|nr:hypothetical protein GH714_036363 [Hevea brasiliensis]